MATQLTKKQFIEILLDDTLTKEEDLRVFQAMYSFDNHRARASQIGRLLGSKTKMPGSPINLQIGRLAKRIAKKHKIEFTIRPSNNRPKSWDIFFNGSGEDRYWVWQLKSQLVEALVELNLTGEIQYSDEIPTGVTTFEWTSKTVTLEKEL